MALLVIDPKNVRIPICGAVQFSGTGTGQVRMLKMLNEQSKETSSITVSRTIRRVSQAVVAALYSFFLVFGFMKRAIIRGASIFSFSSLKTMLPLVFILLFFTSYFVIVFLDFQLDGSVSIRRFKRVVRRNVYLFVASVSVILMLGWFPYFWANLPGSITVDGTIQLGQYFGLIPLSNSNPIFDTMIFGLLFRAGRFVFKTDNGGIMHIVLAQYIVMAIAFTWSIYEGYLLLGKKKSFVVCSLLFFIVMPDFGYAGQVVLKDTLHMAAFMIMLSAQLTVIQKPQTKWSIVYGLSLLLVSLTRAMAFVYALAGGLATVMYFWKEKPEFKKVMTLTVLSSFLLFGTYERILLPLIGAEEYPSSERYAIVLQQVGYIVTKHQGEITDDEIEAIDSMLQYDRIVEEYNQNIADPMKRICQNENKGPQSKFWKQYFMWYLKYPRDMITGLLSSCYQYYYPLSVGFGNYCSVLEDYSGAGLDIYFVHEKARSSMGAYAAKWETNAILSLVMGPGLYTWILIFSASRCVQYKSKKMFCIILPLLILMIGLPFTPVNGDVRYAYPILSSAPLLVALCFNPTVIGSS